MAPPDAFGAIRTQVRHKEVKEVASSDLWPTNNFGFRYPALLSRVGWRLPGIVGHCFRCYASYHIWH